MRNIAIAAAVAALATVALPAAAHAQNWYAGAGYTNFDADGADIGAVTGRLGYRMSPYFAVEGEASTGLDDEDGIELNHNAGLYAVGILPVGQNFDLHGRVGYQMTEVGTPIGDFEDEGVGYGVGATYRFTPNFGVRADYTRLEGDDEAEADAISLGGVVNF